MRSRTMGVGICGVLVASVAFYAVMSTITISAQSKTFIGTLIEVSATHVVARGDGREARFTVGRDTAITPRAARVDDSVRITYIDADVSVALRIEIVAPTAP